MGGGETKWLGIGGARTAGLASRMKHYLQRNLAPTTVIVHLGCNDIFSRPLKEVMECIRQNLSELGKLLPKARIIWSSILPCLFYYGEHRKGAGKDFQRKLDNVGCQYCIRELGGCAISHKDLFRPYAHHLFLKDAIHLSNSGNWVYRQNIENTLCFFNDNPEYAFFPPTW